ncbi:hypothetical protein ACLPHM_02380 [Paenalcaligenes sp. Me131]|uniref:hypothetical protein n=1 Tax=Paenalcaligenes sp. Me131 TaxID=3392636 RepID=UPI003D2DA3BC
MTHTHSTTPNIDGLFYSPTQVLKIKNLSAKDKKVDFLTNSALQDRKVRKALSGITQLAKPRSGIPTEVPVSMEKHRWNPIRAWREYLCLSSESMAMKMNLDVADYLEIEEQPTKLDDETLDTISTKLGIHKQLLSKSIEKYSQAWVFLENIA